MILIRHTSIRPQPNLCYGQFDLPLADSFESEAMDLLNRLSKPTENLWTSPSPRCRILAERIGGTIMPTVDSRLAELNFGQWEGKPWSELRGPVVDNWMQDPWSQRPPGGETTEEFFARVAAFRSERKNEKSACGIVVTHAGVIRAWRSLAENRPWLELFQESIPFGSVWNVD